MMRYPTVLRLLGVAASALALSACVSLLPKSKPADLYRFGQPSDSITQSAQPGAVGVFRTSATFQRESSGDRILTVTSGKVAYLAETRWVAPASVLWDQAVSNAFDADPGPVRLVVRGEPGSADYVMRVDVRNFEARYDHGAKAAPTVVVRVRAIMLRGSDRTLAGERIFESQVAASGNRVSAIIPAYDKAVAEVLKELVAWTNETAQPPTKPA